MDTSVETSVESGGDCDDTSGSSHRDNAEGPGDLIGLYLDGTLADCSTCLDGLDNNCDGSLGFGWDYDCCYKPVGV